jgi:hypothetical protein
MAPQQRPHRSKQDYATPPEFIRAVKELLRYTQFEHDFAADARNAQGLTYWDTEVDSLSLDKDTWCDAVGDGWGWLNPPFTNIGPWAERCMQLRRDGGKVALLVPASVGSNWFRDYVNGWAQVWALNPRLSFDGIGPYPKDCMLCLYGRPPGFNVWTWR